MEGTTFGRYRLMELLGRGGMGEVWRAFDTTTNRVVALKVLPAHLASDPTFEQRFRREAFAAASLNEPHVVPIHNFGEIDGRLYVDMRLVEGRDLHTILQSGPLAPMRAIKIIEQVASALDAAHRIGLVHRDVKPSNILVGEKDFAYLIDFGIARATGETGLTSAGDVVGTWAYLAPERITSGQLDPRSDIYALACVMFECLTGRQPFPGDSLEQQVGSHLGLPPPRPSVVRRGLAADVDTVVAKGMAKNPDERYSTVTELVEAARTAITVPTARVQPQWREPVRQERHVDPPTQRLAGEHRHLAAQGGASPTAPTQQSPASEPRLPAHRPAPPPPPPKAPAPPPASAAPGKPSKSAKRSRILIASVIAVIAVVIAGTVIVLNLASNGESPSATTDSPATGLGAQPSAGGDGLFTGAQPWTTDVSGAAKSDRSDAIIQTLAKMGGWGTDNKFQIDFSVPIFYADSNTPQMRVVGREDYCFGGAPDCDSVPAQMPVPQNANVGGSSNLTCDNSGNTPGQDDCPLLVVDRNANKLYETYQATQDGETLMVTGFFIWDLNKQYPQNLRGDQCTSADAGGFPIAALTPTADEVASGTINHTLRFILPNDRMKHDVYVHPASHAGGPESTDPNAPPYGVRFRLKADFDESGYSDSEKVVLRALKTYGMLLSDGGQVPLTFADDRTSMAKWADLGIDAQSFSALTADQFEVVELGPEIPLTYDCVRSP